MSTLSPQSGPDVLHFEPRLNETAPAKDAAAEGVRQENAGRAVQKTAQLTHREIEALWHEAMRQWQRSQNYGPGSVQRDIEDMWAEALQRAMAKSETAHMQSHRSVA